MSNAIRVEAVATWFHKRDFSNSSPAECLNQVNTAFLNMLERKGLHLRTTTTQFRKSMSELLCMTQVGQLTNRFLCGPLRPLPIPENWTKEAETSWTDHIQSYLLGDDVWDSFWGQFHTAFWEDDVPSWRMYYQLIAPEYIKRDIQILSNAGLMFQDNDGEIVDAMDHEYSDEEQ